MFSRSRHVEIFEILVQDVAFSHLGGGFGCDAWLDSPGKQHLECGGFMGVSASTMNQTKMRFHWISMKIMKTLELFGFLMLRPNDAQISGGNMPVVGDHRPISILAHQQKKIMNSIMIIYINMYTFQHLRKHQSVYCISAAISSVAGESRGRD